MNRVLIFILCVFAFASVAQAQITCTDDQVSLYHDCLIGCGSEFYYDCIEICNETAGFANCPDDDGGREGGLKYHALVRGVETYCNCGQGGMSKGKRGKCVSKVVQMMKALKVMRYFAIIDSDFFTLEKNYLKSIKKSCRRAG